MTTVYWKLEHAVSNGSTWNTATILTQYYDPTLTVSLGDGRDTFSFKVTNFNESFDNFFNVNDKVTISRKINSTSMASSDVLMIGTIQKAPQKDSRKGKVLVVEGTNFTETLMNANAFFDPTGVVIPVAIDRGLTSVKVSNSKFGLDWDSTNNPSVKSDGTAFPTVQEKWFNKSLKEFIQKYSSASATGDGAYYYYVSTENKLRWGPRTNAIAGRTFNSETDTYRSLQVIKDTKDVRNWLIIRCGIDPKGKAIQTYRYDLASINKHGRRSYILNNIANNAETLFAQDLASRNDTQASEMAFPFTPAWSGGTSYANFDDYVVALRQYAKDQGELAGDKFLEARAKGKLSLEIEFEPGKAWVLGDVVACTVPSLSSSAKNMRVVEIQYATDGDRFTLEEDVGSL